MIIRIDDFPTGVRPIPPNHIKEFSPILEKFETAQLPYFLGVVPMLCDDSDFEFLKNLKYMVPAMHGCDHLNPIYAPLLKNDDPYNTRGLAGNENEFGCLNKNETYNKLDNSFHTLTQKLHKNIGAFIPPFNKMNDFVEGALIKMGIGLILGENIRSKFLPVISSGKSYIRSNQFEGLNLSESSCITLHLTWEWDLIREDKSKLNELIQLIGKL